MASYEIRGNSIRGVVRMPGGGKKTESFESMAQYEEWAARMEQRKQVGRLSGPAGSNKTAGELFELYEEIAGATDSAKWNLLRLRKWQKDPIAKLAIGSMVTHDINQWAQRALGTGLSPSSVRRELNLMSGCFTWAVKVRKWIAVNPCHGADRLVGHTKTRKPKSLTPKQIKAVCISTGFATDPKLATKTARVGAAWLLALETGMRSGEILRLRPEHYLKRQRTVHVAAEERGGRKSSKSGRAEVDPSRNVPLTERAMELLDLLLKTMPAGQDEGQQAEMMAACGMLKPPYIVGLCDSQRDSLWRKARDQAGLEDWTFHDSKHEAATRLAPFLDPVELSHAIGTKDIRLLRDTYYIADASRAAARLPSRLMD